MERVGVSGRENLLQVLFGLFLLVRYTIGGAFSKQILLDQESEYTGENIHVY